MTDPEQPSTTAREILLVRRGLVFLSSRGSGAGDDRVQAVELELADLGYVLSSRLRERVASSTLDELTAWRAWALRTLSAALGANQRHEPLFRSFPKGIPADTATLWWRKALTHYLQADGQPCLWCRRIGTTHVLKPCRHVVCDHCWDGANYSACPVCEHQVDRSSPFFEAVKPHPMSSQERVKFKLLDLGDDIEAESRALFVSLCQRKQALSPDDRDALGALLREFKARALGWVPETIPVRENVAIVFGTLFQHMDAGEVLSVARRFMTTATDVLRFLAVLSGADASLQQQTIRRPVKLDHEDGMPIEPRTWLHDVAIKKGLMARPHIPGEPQQVSVSVHRFQMARLPRSRRRALLSLLEGMPADRLTEDMLRHQSYWVWVGEMLHPAEYAKRYPHVAAAFAVIRKKAPDGTKAPRFRTFHSRAEAAVTAGDAATLTSVLAERPGELARRVDLALRMADNDADRGRVLEGIADKVPAFATPVLLTLRAHLSTRGAPAARRLFWPKGQVAKGISEPDQRPVLSAQTISSAVRPMDAELLSRFRKKPAFEDVLIDEALRGVVVPFNERTASRSAVSLPRGSKVPVPEGKTLRMFLHWCQPERGGITTDLDLSVGFYDDAWNHTGVCSYYQLHLPGAQGTIAVSSGDLRNAPFPFGATEFVDVHRDRALAAGFRWAVMVVNAYSGMAFSELDRAFAGLMLRDDAEGAHFDPRTATLKLALEGDHGVFMPLVLDLRESTLHWLDVYSKGQIEFNNVATSNRAISRVCPEMIDYFASGARPSMFDLGLYHAAARSHRVFVRPASRGDQTAPAKLFVRRPDEDVLAFYQRLVCGEANEHRARLPAESGPPLLALLFRGDVDLPEGSVAYALFRERVTPSLSASDLLS